MARDTRAAEALAEAKPWLASVLAASGHTKASLARETGVGTRTITTIFDEEDGLANGVNLYRILRALELLKDPPAETDTVTARLERIETIARRLDVWRAAQKGQDEMDAAKDRLGAPDEPNDQRLPGAP